MVDNRNFELMADGLVGAQPAMDETTVRALGGTLLRVAAYLRGDEAPALAVDASSLCAADKAFVDAVDAVLSAATPSTPESPQPALATLFDASIAAVLSAPTTWVRADAYLALGRLAGIARALERRTSDLAGPAKKGKKRPAALVQLAVGLRTAREALPKRLAEVAAAVGREIEWPKEGLVDDEALVSELSGRVVEARRAMREAVAGMITSK